ncbi:hypothetical protein PI124_g7798 [Phytophthora idaei]|nr:hypothetical protein PI125_g8362 [Phytophthora idaei]KAG3158346.1 hypothetical protein PI126_g7890 [Phytophthora idaei]KAG3247501.1 hypothetical protein PI124_g7798 [Phytophthora idaei]
MPSHPSQARVFAILLVFCCWASLAPAYFEGNCYSYHNILATMCAEVSSVCTSNSCYSSDGDISYTCYSPYSCSGSYTVPAATIATPTSSSSDSNGADNCNSMSLSSCHYLVGCSCYSCVETNGNIEASCTAPFECTPMISSPHNKETNDAPSIGDGDYGVVCAVFLATAIILGGSTVFVARFCFPDNTKEPSIKQTVTHRLSSVAWCLYTLVSFASFVQDDGASVTFIDYLCDKNELFGLIDWRKKTAAVRPRWMRAAPVPLLRHSWLHCRWLICLAQLCTTTRVASQFTR